MGPAVRPFPEWPGFVTGHSVTFVRHGEKSGPGFSADLTPKGRTDSQFAGSKIPVEVDLFLASPSPRTVSTAKCIRAGNGSEARVVIEDQLAEPGNGFYTDYRSAMKSFVTRILELVDEAGADVTVAATHNYVVDYVAALFGIREESSLLCGITVDLDTLRRVVTDL